MSSTEFKKHMEKIMQLTGLTDKEKQICNLIIAAHADNNITDVVSLGERYYSFKLDNDEKAYEVCFGRDADTDTHPDAVRVARETKFVNDLLCLKVKKYDKLNKEEKQICNLVIAARTVGIITEVTELGEGYYKFKLQNGMTYEACFDKNPDRTKHPHAERAIRASEFVSDILRIVDTSYNCFVVPAIDISAPDAKDIGRRIFAGSSTFHNISLSKKSSTGTYMSAYELDVTVSVISGKDIERVAGTLAVKLLHSNGKRTITYEHKKYIDHDTVNAKEYEGKEILSDRSIRDLTYLLDHITGDHGAADANKNKMEILDALIVSEESGFNAFIARCRDNSVGQVTVRPSSIFVDAVPEKTFTYQVSRKGEDVTYPLEFSWNKQSKEFNDKTQLYIIQKGGSLQGITYNSTLEDYDGNSVKLEEFEKDNDRIVIVSRFEDGKFADVGLTLLYKAPQYERSTPETYKGITDYAVAVSDISDAILNAGARKDAFYHHSDTTVVNGNRYLKADVSTCEYSGELVWRGNLVQSYYVKNGNMEHGWVHKDKIPVCTCAFCEMEFRATLEEHAKYKNSHTVNYSVLPNIHYCDKCPTDRAIKKKNGSVEMEYRLYRDILNPQQTSRNAVVVDVADINYARHVLKCANCDNLAVHVDGVTYGQCASCNAFICKVCMSGRDYYDSRLGYHLCPECYKATQTKEYKEFADKILSVEDYNRKSQESSSNDKNSFTSGVYAGIKRYMQFMKMSDSAYIDGLLLDYRKRNGSIDTSVYYNAIKDNVNVRLLKHAVSLNLKRKNGIDEFAYIRIDVMRGPKKKAKNTVSLIKTRSYYFTYKNGRIKIGKEDN